MSNMLLEDLYGNYRNRKFTDVFPDEGTFLEKYYSCGIPCELQDEANVRTLYYLLYSRYGNSTIASFDEKQFELKVFATVFEFGPTWEKELDIQRKVRQMNEDELTEGTTQIINKASNPDIAPNDHALAELPFISEQNVAKTKRGKVEQYAVVLDLLKRDVTEFFLGKFRKLFLSFVAPELPLWYVEED